MSNMNNINFLSLCRCILHGLPRSTRQFAVPNGKDSIRHIYHISVPHNHACPKVMVINQSYLIGSQNNPVIPLDLTR